MSNFTTCGSLFLKDTDFKAVNYEGNKIITDANTQTITGVIKASCGLAFDSGSFKKLSNCMSVSTAITATNVTGSPCGGTFFDSKYFTLTGNVLSYGSGMNATLTFTTTPETATVTLVDESGNSVTVKDKVANVILGRTYTWTCSDIGYVAQTESIKITNNAQTKDIVLKANP